MGSSELEFQIIQRKFISMSSIYRSSNDRQMSDILRSSDCRGERCHFTLEENADYSNCSTRNFLLLRGYGVSKSIPQTQGIPCHFPYRFLSTEYNLLNNQMLPMNSTQPSPPHNPPMKRNQIAMQDVRLHNDINTTSIQP